MSGARGERACVTGAAGFVGSGVVRALLRAGWTVRAAIRPGSEPTNLGGLEVECVEADVRDAASVAKCLRDCRWVFHGAAFYRFGRVFRRIAYDVNVEGTRNVVEAVRRCGCERLIYTSTAGTLGRPRGRAASSEEAPVDLDALQGAYKGTKYIAEHVVLRAACRGLPVVIVQPTFPVGVGDRTPTPSGQMVLDFLNGRMPAYVDTGLNVADVDDVANGHLLAAERGRPGQSYLLGGENLTLREIFERLERLTRLRAPRLRLPPGLLVPVAHASEWIEGRLLGRAPTLSLEALRMAKGYGFFDDSLARRELGYTSVSADVALAKGVAWFVKHGYVRRDRVSAMSLQALSATSVG